MNDKSNFKYHPSNERNDELIIDLYKRELNKRARTDKTIEKQKCAGNH
jgi:hypothetical protein